MGVSEESKAFGVFGDPGASSRNSRSREQMAAGGFTVGDGQNDPNQKARGCRLGTGRFASFVGETRRVKRTNKKKSKQRRLTCDRLHKESSHPELQEKEKRKEIKKVFSMIVVQLFCLFCFCVTLCVGRQVRNIGK